MDRLLAGYRRFRQERWPEQRELYESLAEGQRPRLLVIACCDSRVDPSTIFRVRPGELFVIRNVANLVPPFEQGEGLHGTSAAIEFAVERLEVQTILILGHARCGGIAAALDDRLTADTYFLSSWIELLKPAVRRSADLPGDPHGVLEEESIKVSMERLGTFPFIKRRLEAERLAIEGALFNVADGSLRVLDRTSGKFLAVS